MAAVSVLSYICCMVMDCLGEVSHVMTHHLGCWSRTSQGTNSKVIRKWKWNYYVLVE